MMSASSSVFSASFNYSADIFGPTQSLILFFESVDLNTGQIRMNAADSRRPSIPFAWHWGDGTTNSGFPPQTHTYTNHNTNFVVRVTTQQGGGQTGFVSTVVHFIAPRMSPLSFPAALAVTVPEMLPPVVNRFNGAALSPSVTVYPAADIVGNSRPVLEQTLTAGALVQQGFVNGNFFRTNGEFRQVLLCDTNLAGTAMYSLWNTWPVSWAVSSNALGARIAWSSCFHEMGHNITLNSPSNFTYGGKITGNANAILSETLAQIFQHATLFELINHKEEFGFDDSIVADLESSAHSTMAIVRSSYQRYLAQGSPFRSWHDSGVTEDATLNTFMTIAFKFCEHAELAGEGYRKPLKRLMQALQQFDSTWLTRYDPGHDTASGATFRSTMWVAALSHAFEMDLRSEFRNLNFPVDDTIYHEILTASDALADPDGTPTRLQITSSPLPVMRLDGELGGFYRIEYVGDITAGNWLALTNLFVISSPQFVLDQNPAAWRRFYRSVKIP